MTIEQTIRQIRRAYFWRSRLIVFWLATSLFLNLFNWFYVFFSLKKKANVLPLHSSLLFGVDRIGFKNFLFELPIVGFIILILNFIFAYFFYERRKEFVSLLLIIFSCFFQMVLLLAAVLIFKL